MRDLDFCNKVKEIIMSNEQIRQGTGVLLDFHTYKLHNDACRYIRCYLEYGAECASLWSTDHVSDGDRRQFCKLVADEMRKCGFNG